MHRSLLRVEAFAGSLTATFLVFCAATVALLSAEFARPNPNPWLVHVRIAVALCVLVDSPFLIRLWIIAYRGELPFGPVVARRRRYDTLVRRVAGCVWWSAHFLFGMLCVLSVHFIRPQQAVESIFLLLGAFSVNVASNVYLAVLVKAASNNDAIVDRLWRHRFTIDVAVVGIALLLHNLIA